MQYSDIVQICTLGLTLAAIGAGLEQYILTNLVSFLNQKKAHCSNLGHYADDFTRLAQQAKDGKLRDEETVASLEKYNRVIDDLTEFSPSDHMRLSFWGLARFSFATACVIFACSFAILTVLATLTQATTLFGYAHLVENWVLSTIAAIALFIEVGIYVWFSWLVTRKRKWIDGRTNEALEAFKILGIFIRGNRHTKPAIKRT